MSDRLSRRQASELCGLSEATIRYHIGAGNITAGPDGKLARADVETLRSSQRVLGAKADERAAALLKVRALGSAVKVKNLRLNIQALQARTIERAGVALALDASATAVLARIHSWPERHTDRVAAELDIAPADARKLLAEFAELALAELGDIREEAAELLARL